jgi:hypothetical protein
MSEIGPGSGEGGDATPVSPSEVKTVEQRKKILADSIQREVIQGSRVESQSEFQAVLVHGERPNHVLHAIITFFTCGLWGIVWIVIALTGGERRTMIVVDDYGNALIQRLGKK